MCKCYARNQLHVLTCVKLTIIVRVHCAVTAVVIFRVMFMCKC